MVNGVLLSVVNGVLLSVVTGYSAFHDWQALVLIGWFSVAIALTAASTRADLSRRLTPGLDRIERGLDRIERALVRRAPR